MIGGSIARIGQSYAVTLQATNCKSGENLASQQVEAKDKEHVLRAVSTAATKMRAKLGESLSSIQKLDQPLEQVTTSSLEALQYYALASDEIKKGSPLASIPFLTRATELDPNFAMAWAKLGIVYYNARDLDHAAGYYRKAFTLIDRVTEREKLDISGDYYWHVTGELDKSIDVFQLYARTYPRYARPHNALGNQYNTGGEPQKALPEYEESIRLEPGAAASYNNLAHTYMRLDRFDEAKATIERALALNLPQPTLHLRLLEIALFLQNQALAESEMKWFAGKPNQYAAFAAQASNAAAFLRLRDAGQFSRQAIDVVKRKNLPGSVAQYHSAEAEFEAVAGNCDSARSEARAAMLPDEAPAEIFDAAFAFAFCGDSQARKIADETSKRYPLDTIWNAVSLPAIEAAMELNRGQPGKAVELLQLSTPYEREYAEPVYLRGLSYLRLRKGPEAAAEFQKILSHKGAYWGIFYPASYFGLARAATLSGDTAKAKEAYQDFFAISKDANSDVPLLVDARKEYAALH